MNGLGYFKTNRIKQKYHVKNSKMLIFIVILSVITKWQPIKALKCISN